MEPNRLAQKVQDEMGYLIVQWSTPLKIGDVIRTVHLNSGIGVGDTVVIGEATLEEFREQVKRYTNSPGEAVYPYFYKVRAE